MTKADDARSTRPRARQLDLSSEPSRVLVVDDDTGWRASVRGHLMGAAHFVDFVSTPSQALNELDRLAYDAVLVSVGGVGDEAFRLLRALRTRDDGLPVLLVARAPDVDTAAEAVAQGAFRYLPRTICAADLVRALDDAVSQRRADATGVHARTVAVRTRRQLEDAFASALRSLTMAYQPIVAVEGRSAMGFEALMRSSERALPHPGAVIDAAEYLGATRSLGRRIRRLVADRISLAPPDAVLFVNLHSSDLTDPDLLDRSAPLSRHAARVVLEITERASLETIEDLESRIQALRRLGYRIAIDDLGAGYAGLTSFARVRPDIAKIDMSLVRGIDADLVRQRVVHALVGLASGLGAEVVAEGVETIPERDMLVSLGCRYLQGYLLGRPIAGFAGANWP